VGECIFCQIIEGKVAASVVHRDDVVMAFMDIRPVNTGHVLVVPLRHFAEMSDMDEETGMKLFQVTMRVQKSVRASGVRCEGINLFLADGEAAFQEVFHVHMHIIPRFRGDSFKIKADWSRQPSRADLDDVAGKIRGAY
jgi:histidine triad (HIT) family protein